MNIIVCTLYINMKNAAATLSGCRGLKRYLYFNDKLGITIVPSAEIVQRNNCNAFPLHQGPIKPP